MHVQNIILYAAVVGTAPLIVTLLVSVQPIGRCLLGPANVDTQRPRDALVLRELSQDIRGDAVLLGRRRNVLLVLSDRGDSDK
jgi:hypothetical protein